MSKDTLFQEADASLSARGSAMTIRQLFKKWEQLVSEVERGYHMTVYDYTNDLSSRDIIERTMQDVSEDTRARIADIVGPLDERFKRCTETISDPLMSRDGFWWRRVPLGLASEFQSQR